MRSLGIDHLTALDLTPEQFIRAAGAAGFASVSLRTIHIPGGVPSWGSGPVETAALAQALVDTGLRLHAVEAIAITPTLVDELEALRAPLQQASELGAEFVYGFSDDPDAERCAHTVAAVGALAAEFGLGFLLEPMPYRSVPTLDRAAAIVAETPGAGVVVDTLHAHRGGTTPDMLAALPPRALAVLQLCDAPLSPPAEPSPSGLHPLLHEARLNRRVPGRGDLPLREYVAAMPASALITVEAPAVADGTNAVTRLSGILRETLAAIGDLDLTEGSA